MQDLEDDIMDPNFPHLCVKRKNITKVYTEGIDQQSQSMKKNFAKVVKILQKKNNILNFLQKYHLYQIST